MLQIKVSYDHDAELMAVTKRLADLDLRISKKPYESGGHRRVYMRGNVKDASGTSPGEDVHHQTE